MRYNLLRWLLKLLIYAKRGLWWSGRQLGRGGKRALIWGWQSALGPFYYRSNYWWQKKKALNWQNLIFNRALLQILGLVLFLFIAFPQTNLYAKKESYRAGQKTFAYGLSQVEQDFSVEEIFVETADMPTESSEWRQGALGPDLALNAEMEGGLFHEQDIAGVVAGGAALSKPALMSGVSFYSAAGSRTGVVEYTVAAGDSTGLIAQKFGISLATLLWENNLTERSFIRPGQTLKIPPVSGIMHTVKKGDTVSKIAKLYKATAADVIKFNNLKEDGSDLKVGERLMVPEGVRPYTAPAVSGAARTTQSLASGPIPGRSSASPSVSGFIWPTSARTVTQYYNWQHHALDVAGPWQSAIYAAKSGRVTISQCGWNGGYGCYVVVDHGGGVKTVYGHNSKLLVAVGDEVERGQTIALMGNTGNVRGRTGIHLHFELQISGARVNPLGYIR